MNEIAINKAAELIKRFEGCKLTAYLCPADVWTIGYGHTKGVKEGDVWTQQQADEALKQDIPVYMSDVLKSCPTLADYPNRLAACTSLAYNIGPGNFASSTVARYIRRGEYRAAADAFGMWVFSKGKRLQGLVNRRAAEREIFLLDGTK